MKLKRFLLFMYSEYYPVGGWGDFRGSFDTVAQARDVALRFDYDVKQFVDMETGEEFGMAEENGPG